MPERFACWSSSALLFLSAVLAAGCGDSASDDAQSNASAGRLTGMEAIEEATEAAANRLIEFSDLVRRRDFGGAAPYLTSDFQGSAWVGLGTEARTELPTGAERVVTTPSPGAELLTRESFLASLQERLSVLESIEYVFFKTRSAEFDADARRGRVTLTAQVIGRGASSRAVSIYAWAHGEVVKRGDRWQLSQFVIDKLQDLERERPLFTNVAEPAGVAVTLPRLGRDGNSTFYWRGASIGDIDGDGRFDVFTSTHDRGYLYRNRGDGTFEDVAERAGIADASGVTGSVFFDFDRDGDQDLFQGHVGWEQDGVPYGKALVLLRNDGEGRFTDVSSEVGLDRRMNAFSIAVADYDADGWLDLYVCNYPRLDAVYPDSWYRATNGLPNALLRNVEGRKFEDVASGAGLAGRSWSYAAAFADYDADGDQDLYVANDYGDNNLYRNRGDGTFEDVATELGLLDTGNGMAAAWGDLDGDGQLDLYVSNMSSSAGNRILKRLAQKEGSEVESTLFKLAAGNSIFLQRNGKFERLPAEAGGIGASWAWGPSLLDINLDGHLDLYVANGFISGNSLKDT